MSLKPQTHNRNSCCFDFYIFFLHTHRYFHTHAVRHTHRVRTHSERGTKAAVLSGDLCCRGWDWGWCVSHLKGGTSVLHLRASPYEISRRAKLWYSVKGNAYTSSHTDTHTHTLRHTSLWPLAKPNP